ncbi:MAG: hypothetical protein QXO70_04695 [Candidatus Pacearchaeota archaeon]
MKSKVYFAKNTVCKFFLLTLFPLFLLNNCFEYEETIHFKKNFTGYVEITYTVPLHPSGDRSLIRFLPIQKEDIENRINKGFFSKNISIRNYNLKFIELPPWTELAPSSAKPLFSKKARVYYIVDFEDLGQLDDVLLGYLFVKKKGYTLNVRREFKSIVKPLDQDSSDGEKKIFFETQKLLGDGYILFRVLFPQNFECRSNRGEIGQGFLIFKLPLVDTIEKAGPKLWDYTLIGN